MNISFGPSKPAQGTAGDAPQGPATATQGQAASPSFKLSFANSGSGVTPPDPTSPATNGGGSIVASDASAVAGVTLQAMPGKISQAKVAEFKQLVASLYTKFPQKEHLGMVMKRILIDLDENNELAEFLSPDDRGQMIRALRDNYGAAAEMKAKKTAAKKAKKKESAFANLGELLAQQV